MFGDEMIYNVYEKGPTFSGASQSIKSILPYFAHKNCNANILEIGAGNKLYKYILLINYNINI